MKVLVLSSLLIMASCGNIDGVGTTTLGQEKTYSPVTADASLTAQLAVICQSLQQKAQVLSQLTTTPYVFDVSKKACTDSNYSSALKTPVLIQKPNSTYIFKLNPSGLDFVFPNVETDTSGSLGEICAALSSLTNPMKLQNGNVIWLSTAAKDSDCKVSSGDERCLAIETGYLSYTTQMYVVNSKEWIKFYTLLNKPRTGFFNYRKLVSNAQCAVGETQETLAVLE
jgi:hypothetical protein